MISSILELLLLCGLQVNLVIRRHFDYREKFWAANQRRFDRLGGWRRRLSLLLIERLQHQILLSEGLVLFLFNLRNLSWNYWLSLRAESISIGSLPVRGPAALLSVVLVLLLNGLIQRLQDFRRLHERFKLILRLKETSLRVELQTRLRAVQFIIIILLKRLKALIARHKVSSSCWWTHLTIIIEHRTHEVLPLPRGIALHRTPNMLHRARSKWHPVRRQLQSSNRSFLSHSSWQSRRSFNPLLLLLLSLTIAIYRKLLLLFRIRCG